MRKRLTIALAAYAILGVIAWFRLEGNIRYAVLLVFGLFAMRSIVAVKGGMTLSRNEPPPPDADSEMEHPDR